MQKQDQLSNIQITVLVASTIIGVNVLTLPRMAAQNIHVDGVFATFAFGVLSVFFAISIAVLSKRFPNQTVIEYSQDILGEPFGKLYGVFIAFYTCIVSGITLRSFSDALKTLILPRTPLEVIMVSMLIVVVYLIGNGISSIAKIAESFFPVILLALSLLMFLNLGNFDLEEFRPMFSKGLLPIVKSFPNIFPAYLGYGILLFMVPFMKEPKKLVRYTVFGMIMPIIIYTGLVGITIGVFGDLVTEKLSYPTIVMAKQIEFPGAFVERFDIVFIALWIMGVFVSLSVYYYIAAFSTTRLLGLKHYKSFIYLFAPFVYLVSILPQNIFQIEPLVRMTGYFGILLTLVSILMLLLATLSRKGADQ
jgi:spore germination protein